MAFKLKKNESAASGIRRVVREEIDDALELVKKGPADPETAVHELRKHFKRIRAVLRLVRDELGEEVYEREDGALRELGRRLAPARDASIRASSLDRLREAYEKDFPGDGVAPVKKRLAARRGAALRPLQRKPAFSPIGRELETLRRRVPAWPLRKSGFDGLASGLRRIYRQGRESEARAYASQADEDFHEWRKRSKDLRYGTELLEPVWPEAMKDVEKALHDLTDRLGDDHDFAELRKTLTGPTNRVDGAHGLKTLLDLIDRRRAELQAAARPLGKLVYAEKPAPFARRIESYWNTWRS
jgi:CHAD domain-containing protein